MNAGQIFDREKIYEVVWGFEANGDSAVIKEQDVYKRQAYCWGTTI